jgi:hypothetical protein
LAGLKGALELKKKKDQLDKLEAVTPSLDDKLPGGQTKDKKGLKEALDDSIQDGQSTVTSGIFMMSLLHGYKVAYLVL